MARFQERAAWTNPSTDTGQSQMYGSLAQKLQGYAGTLMDVHQDVRIADAKEEASQADPREGELKNDVTVFGKTFNDIMIRSNQAAIKSDYSLRLEELYINNQDNPEGFKMAVEESKEASLANALPQTRQMLEIGYDNLAGGYSNQILAGEKRKALKEAELEQKNAVSRFQRDIERFIATGQDKSAYEEVAGLKTFLDSGDFTDEEKRVIIENTEKSINEQLRMNELETLLEAGGDNEVYQRIAEWTDDIPENYSPDEWSKFIRKADLYTGSYLTRKQNTQNMLSMEQTRQLSDLEISIRSGQGDPVTQQEMLDQFRDKGMSESKYVSLSTALNTSTKDSLELAQTYAGIDKVVQGDRATAGMYEAKDYDGYYANSVQLAKKNGTPLSNAQKAHFVTQTGHMPKPMLRQITSNLDSGVPELVEQASDLIDRLDDSHGFDIDKIPEKYYGLAHQFTTNSMYMPREQAMEKAREVTNPANKAVVEQRRMALQNKGGARKRAKSYMDVVTSEFGPNLPENIRSSITADYQGLYESLYMAGVDDEDVLEERVMKQIKKIWAKSEITDQPVMRYPYERYYGELGITAAKNDLLKRAQNAARVHHGYEGLKREDVILVGDDDTSRLVTSGQPSYLMYVKLPWGWTKLANPKTGNELRWGPPMDKLKYARQKAGEAAKKKSEHMIKKYETERMLNKRPETDWDELQQFGQ